MAKKMKFSDREVLILKKFKGIKSMLSLKGDYAIAMGLSKRGFLVPCMFGTFMLNEKHRDEVDQLS